MHFKRKLMAGTALLGVWLLLPATAGAQSASDAQKIEKLERQTELLQKQSELLQRQLKEVQEELARTRRKTEKVEAKVEAAPARYSAPAGALVTKGPPPPPPPERVKVTLGGFLAAETVWRQHTMVNDVGKAFAPTPYPFSLQREGISRVRPAEPNLAARRGQHRSLPEAFRVLRVGLPGRRQHVELQPEQQLGCAFATRLFHLRQQRLGISHPRRPNVEPPDPEPGRDHAAQGEHPAHHRRELRGRVQLSPPMADPRGGGRLSGHLPRRVGRKSGRDRRRQHGHRTARNRRRIR